MYEVLMNTIPVLFNLTLFQAPAETPYVAPTDWTLLYLAIVLIVIVVIGVGGLLLLLKSIFWKTESGKARQTIFAVPSQPDPNRVPAPRNSPHDLPLSKATKPQTATDSQPPPAIFISYRREDSIDVTGRIYDRLCQHFGKQNVFKDVDSIPLGVDFRKHLGDSVGQCNVLLTIIGRQWLAGDRGQRRLDDIRDFVRIEMEAALKRDIPVVPVLVQGSSMPSLEDLPEILQSLVYRNGIPVRPDPDFHQDMDKLIKGIEGYLKKKSNS
jgi:hypothetical protein